MEDALLTLFLKTAQACILVQDRCRPAGWYCVDIGYTSTAGTCRECSAACKKLTDLCLSKDLGVYLHALECARLCQVCAEECGRSQAHQLRTLVEACGETAELSRRLAQATLEERRKLLTSPLPPVEVDPGDGAP